MNSIKSWKTLDCKHVIASAVYCKHARRHITVTFYKSVFLPLSIADKAAKNHKKPNIHSKQKLLFHCVVISTNIDFLEW